MNRLFILSILCAAVGQCSTYNISGKGCYTTKDGTRICATATQEGIEFEADFKEVTR